MQASKLYMLLFAQAFPIHALASPIRSLESHTRAAVAPAIGHSWSKQDILTLIGVCVAVVTGFIALVGILIASPRTREWLCRPFDCFTQCLRPGKNSLFLIRLRKEFTKAD